MSDREQTTDLIERWRLAFHAVNRGCEEPSLTYERGWFVFRYRMVGGIPHRVRKLQLVEMVERLERKAVA